MKNRLRSLFAWVWLFVVVVTSCQKPQTSDVVVEHDLDLNQCLLRDAADGMSRMWEIDIRLSSKVAEIDDLWIDYAPEDPVTLEQALDEILVFVHERHSVMLRWSIEGDGVLITNKPANKSE